MARSNGRTMRAMQDNVGMVAKVGLCMGCGTCQSVCPVSAVTIRLEAHSGCLKPRVDERLCSHCGKCVAICPGRSMKRPGSAAPGDDGSHSDDVIGRYEACFVGHAVPPTIRYRSASGGLVTALLVHALELGRIDGALVTRLTESDPLHADYIIARTAEDITSACGSKYCPTATNVGLSTILAHEGRYAVVGLPCQLHAIRTWEQTNAVLAARIVLHVGLFCANNNTYLGTEYFLWQHGIAPDDVAEIRYRGEGWPGKVVVALKDGRRVIIPRGSTEPKWYRRALFSSAFHYHFPIPRCLLCADQTCEAADISCGDPWLRELTATERVGVSLLITRNERGAEAVSEAVDSGAIELQPVDIGLVRRAQNYAFKRDVGGRLWLRRAFGRAVPEDDNRMPRASLRSVWSGLRYLPCFVSHHRRLWPLLRVWAILEGGARLLAAGVRRRVRRLFSTPSPQEGRHAV